MKPHRWRKRFPASRVMVTLASTSLALVLFSATVYASVIPSVLADDGSTLPQTGESADRDDGINVWERIFGSESPNAGNEAAAELDAASGLTNAFSSLSDALMGSPTFSSLNAYFNEASQEEATASGEDPAERPLLSYEQSPSGPYEEPSPEPYPPVVDDATEEAIHAHLVKLYQELPSYYNQVCGAYNELYDALSPEHDSSYRVRYASVKPHALQSAVDQQRINVFSGGPYIPSGGPDDEMKVSKWYQAANEIRELYNHLTNACSVLWETEGMSANSAWYQLKRYLDSDGNVSELVAFERGYPNVRL